MSLETEVDIEKVERNLDSEGYQVCANCEENDCAIFDVDDNEELPPDQLCHICDNDAEPCSVCWDMMYR